MAHVYRMPRGGCVKPARLMRPKKPIAVLVSCLYEKVRVGKKQKRLTKVSFFFFFFDVFILMCDDVRVCCSPVVIAR